MKQKQSKTKGLAAVASSDLFGDLCDSENGIIEHSPHEREQLFRLALGKTEADINFETTIKPYQKPITCQRDRYYVGSTVALTSIVPLYGRWPRKFEVPADAHVGRGGLVLFAALAHHIEAHLQNVAVEMLGASHRISLERDIHIYPNVKSQRPEPDADGVRIVPDAKRLAPVRCTVLLAVPCLRNHSRLRPRVIQ
jgi:hypothetical protein